MFSNYTHDHSHSHHHHHYFQRFRDWWNDKVNPTVNDLAVMLPEAVSYPIGVALIDLQGAQGVGGAFTLPQAGSIAFAMGWNYFDAIDSIMAGVNHILDDKDYRKVKYFQGILDILSGAQALTFTYCPPITAAAGLGALSLAGPAFAFMMLCDLINSAIDFYYPAKELKFKGWLHERVKEVNFILKNMLKHQLRMLEIENSNKANREKYQRKIIKLQYKINGLIAKRDRLLNDIAARTRVYLDRIDTSSEKNVDEVQKRINCIIYNPLDTHLDMDINKPPSQEDLAREAELVEQIRKNFKKQRLNLIIKGLSFSGMLLLAIAPFTGPAAPFVAIPGLVIVSFVAGYYLYKHRDKIKQIAKDITNHVSVAMHSIFHKSHKKEPYHPVEFSFSRPSP